MDKIWNGVTIWSLFTSVADWNGWSTEEKLAQLWMSLRRAALKVLKDLPETEKRNFRRLCKALEAAFDPPERLLLHKAAFRARHKSATVSISQYGAALRTLAAKAYPRRATQDLEEILDQFIDGLVDDRLQEHVLLSHPSTFGQAVQYATEFESLARSRVKSVKKPQLAGTKVETSTAPEAASH